MNFQLKALQSLILGKDVSWGDDSLGSKGSGALLRNDIFMMGGNILKTAMSVLKGGNPRSQKVRLQGKMGRSRKSSALA